MLTGLTTTIAATPGQHELRAEFVAADHGQFQLPEEPIPLDGAELVVRLDRRPKQRLIDSSGMPHSSSSGAQSGGTLGAGPDHVQSMGHVGELGPHRDLIDHDVEPLLQRGRKGYVLRSPA